MTFAMGGVPHAGPQHHPIYVILFSYHFGRDLSFTVELSLICEDIPVYIS